MMPTKLKTQGQPTQHAQDLQRMWAGEFGKAYVARNCDADERSGAFHHDLCQRLGVRTVLEVGCNIGLNLTQIDRDASIDSYGIDIGGEALQRARERLNRVRLSRACAYQLPFDDGAFDLVFTCGVLIHLPPSDLTTALHEIVRVSRRYIWCGEYASDEPTELPYRGMNGALFKRDFGQAYKEAVPELSEIDRGFLAKGETPFDDLTWWLFDRTES
ncbi:MAG: methyltransferase domain-containing protein [Phycisphaerae bacterium]|nr:methyltransferase domain-containing protein [Phycisphaerales bacterium]